MTRYVIIGRGPDCTVVLSDPSVSARHVRLSWRNGLVLIEDLASANGTWVAGKRVQTALVRPGDEVILGTASLPWSRPELRGFLRQGARGTELAVRPGRPRSLGRVLGHGALLVLGAAGVGLLVALCFPGGRDAIRSGSDQVLAYLGTLRPAGSDYEAYIRRRLAPGVRQAIDPSDPAVRNVAVQLAARQPGAFRIEQVAAIWSFLRERWRYVNDPQGREYFARARETIQNGYAGDCDDFAITLAAMLGAIGGETRVVFMEGPRGGHAYAEVCIHQDPTRVAAELGRYYARSWARYTSRGRPRQIAFRRTEACPVWLNLDWNASVPGGEYDPEAWAVAIYPDGRTETLSPAGGAAASAAGSGAPRQHATPPAAP